VQAKVDAKEDFMEKKREEHALVLAARSEEARLREEYQRQRLDLKVFLRLLLCLQIPRVDGFIDTPLVSPDLH